MKIQIGYQTVFCIFICNQTTNNAAVSPPDVDDYEIQYNNYDIRGGPFGIYSSGTKTTQRAVKRPMETT